jgi:hypothetical protein
MICCHRREVELMYDNAMQAMIRKKEEEFAQLQVMTSFIILIIDVLILGPGGSLLYVVVPPIGSTNFDIRGFRSSNFGCPIKRGLFKTFFLVPITEFQ